MRPTEAKCLDQRYTSIQWRSNLDHSRLGKEEPSPGKNC